MRRREPDYYEKRYFDDGAILEIKIHVVRAPVRGSRHNLKYWLYYGKERERLVAYDTNNERVTIVITLTASCLIDFQPLNGSSMSC